MSGDLKIKVRGLCKSFGRKVVLHDLDLDVPKGQSLVVIGGSGSGKSVLIKCIIGLMTPEKGSIEIDGQEVLGMSSAEREQIMHKFGMLFQGGALFDSLPVWENVAFGLLARKMADRSAARAKAAEVLAQVGLAASVGDLWPSELSGGMQKRVGIARAIVLEPKYLFCDEPNSGLDPKTALLIDELIGDITVENNITTIINTHDMNSVMEAGDNICFLFNGMLEWSGTKHDVLGAQNENLQSFIFASPFLQRLRDAATK